MNAKIIKRKIRFIVVPIINYIRKVTQRRNYQYRRYYEKLDVIDRTILYESRDGKSITDSPYAIFKYLLHNPEYKDYQHIWSLHCFDDLQSVMNQYKDYKNVKFVKRNSKEYLKCLAASKYLINNSTFQSFFIPKSDQVYINTWHGTPLKSMGFDIPGNPSLSQNVVRNFLSADYLLSPNEHTSNMFLDSYKLKGIYPGEIIEEGYPRIDLTLQTNRRQFQAVLTSTGLTIDSSKKTILYAPTWKGTNVSRAKNDMFQIIADMAYLIDQVGREYNVLIKVHPFLYAEARKFQEIKNILVPDFIDTNELLSAVDLLITDYSSIFFDYLVTDKPILFYVWDYDDYNEERGRSLRDNELPGPILFTIKEVIEAVQSIGEVSVDYKNVYKMAKNRFVNHDDGRVTKRIVDYIFNNIDPGLKVIHHQDKEKKKILIYPGGMMNNGITSSFINLMDNIDFNQYDVSVFINSPSSKEVLNNLAKVNKNARFLFRNGQGVYSIFEIYRDKFVHNRGAHTDFTKRLYPEQAYKRELKRCFGRTKFDIAIDFSGYSLFWAKYLLATDAKKKICYMHNDLLSDSERKINGRRPHRINLRGLFSVYHRFDKLVSVSLGTMELNKKNLAQYADNSKFDYVMNSINVEKILRLSNEVNSDSQDESINSGQLIGNKPFKSWAVIQYPAEHFVWNRPPGLEGAVRVTPAGNYLDQEVMILREAYTEAGGCYKFAIEDRIEGWLDQTCFKLLPDSILSEKVVNKSLILQNVSGNSIWNLPYKVEGVQKVCSSKEYKGVLVDVDIEVRTQHGTYSRISVNGVHLGWIDSSALKMVKKENGVKTSLFKLWNRQKYKRHISHLRRLTIAANSVKEIAAANEGTVDRLEIHKTEGLLNTQAVQMSEYIAVKTIEGTTIPEPSSENFNFINMGRLSPEKAQDNLINAFARFHQNQQNSKLYILGAGPLRKELEDLIAELKLKDSVFLVGQVENPFIIMKKCDCFVLSSHYEGQPMVLLEALTLGMKIVATDIVANRTVLEHGRYGLLVENSIEGIEKGLQEAAEKQPAGNMIEFLPEEYNQKAMGTFYKVLS
ncbi:CDP-glycerol glycerophosphotransferase family protein [Neobacillus kokaensis]|uniref:GW domain-containing protein n=1 Tax=Neobacillus kokaensis TaxID=2759023 RepID=A0ABQ3MXP4_9BACI|nr:CDP-glycerol glycerophosphotransferase family protein [Neobacillus kokaensis]GHH97454.1 hypothetical protein AM1BK_09970 [Neobacillus kokaensis]